MSFLSLSISPDFVVDLSSGSESEFETSVLTSRVVSAFFFVFVFEFDLDFLGLSEIMSSIVLVSSVSRSLIKDLGVSSPSTPALLTTTKISWPDFTVSPAFGACSRTVFI